MSKQEQKPESKSSTKPENKRKDSDEIPDKGLEQVSGGLRHDDESPKE
jgi:hypothetical protein